MRLALLACAPLILISCSRETNEVSSSDLTGKWVSLDTTSLVEFLPDGRAHVRDPLNTLTATWALSGGIASIAVGDTGNVPLEITGTKSGDTLVMRIETDTVRYLRATPVTETAFARSGNNGAINAMTSDLAALKDAQDTYHQLTKRYSATLPMDFTPSAGVSIVISNVTASTWSAMATHPSTKAKCTIEIGGLSKGRVVCG